ncbi:MAG: type II secretion system F family protein [Lachnospiraceae bacterium]|nr:type II secretion system F family protein [Lachnospiraceae bacterium]
MANFRYKAQDAEGKIVTGQSNAANENELHEKLKTENLLLMEASEISTAKRRFKRMKFDRLSDFSRSLSKLLAAGVTLVRALKIISDDESIPVKEREIYSDVLKLVRSGMPLSEALEEQGDTFPSLFVNMIRSAETSGNLDATLDNMANYYSKEYRLNQKISSSMTYPKILGVLIILVVIVIMGFVLPQFEDLFAQMGNLPLPTRILMGISDFVAHRWYILIFAGIILFMAYKVIFSIPFVKYHKDKLEIRLPKIGKLRKVIYTARFARTLSSLYAAGIPIITCLQIAKTTIGNTYIESQFDEMIAKVRAGENLSAGIAGIDGFVKKLTSSVGVGEETGELDSMLVSIADQMDYDSEIATEKLVAMLEPVMIVVMAAIVGFIMIAIIWPIYGSYQSIANTTM